MPPVGFEPAVPTIGQTRALRTRGLWDLLRYFCGIVTKHVCVSAIGISLNKQLDLHKARYKCHFRSLRRHPVLINNNKTKIISVCFSGYQ